MSLPPSASPGVPPPGESSAALPVAVATAGVAAALGTAAVASRDGLFLSTLDATDLPLVMMTAAGVSIAATFALSAWLRRALPVRVAALAFISSAALFAAEWALVGAVPRGVAVALYLHVTGLGPVVISAFWSVVNEQFDPYTAKRAVSHMAAAGALGGVAGGLGAASLVSSWGLAPILLGLALLSLVCGLAILAVGAPRTARAHAEPESGVSGLGLLRRRPLLRQMATLMFLAAVVETLVEYALKVEAQVRFGDAESLVRFFAIFYAVCGALSFVLQVGFGPRVLQALGLASAVALLPGAVALSGAVAAFAGKFWGYVLARGSETVMSGSFFRAGFQLLYTPMPPGVRRPAKVWVDVASGSIGEIVGAGLLFGLLALLPDLSSTSVVALAAVGSVLALIAVRRIHTSYVRQLASSLRDGRVALRVEDALDATTARTIAASHMPVSRQALLTQVRAHREQRERSQAPQPSASASSPATTDVDASRRAGDAGSAESDAGARRLRALLSGDIDPMRQALRQRLRGESGSGRSERQLTGHVLPLLDHPVLAGDAESFLRRVAPRVVGQLVDALLDPGEPHSVKLRIAALLGELEEPRSMAGLLAASERGAFELRLAAARAAASRVARAGAVISDRAAVYALVRRELSVDEETWRQQGEKASPRTGRDRSILLQGRVLEEVSPSLEHVFTLLALVHKREVMASVLAGLVSGDQHLHGTALEYLESVLPSEVRATLWPRLDHSVRSTQGHERDSMAEELLRSSANWVVGRGELGES